MRILVSNRYFQCSFENGILKNTDMAYDLFLFYLHHVYSQYRYNSTAEEMKTFLRQRNFKRTIKLTEKISQEN